MFPVRALYRTLLVVCLTQTLGPFARAQTNPNLENGVVPFGSYDASDFDSIDIHTGNLALHIPLFNYPQRGSLPGDIDMVSNTKSFFVVQSCNPKTGICTDRWQVTQPFGVQIVQVSDTLAIQTPYRVTSPNGIHLVSWDGTVHQMMLTPSGTLESLDATGSGQTISSHQQAR